MSFKCRFNSGIFWVEPNCNLSLPWIATVVSSASCGERPVDTVVYIGDAERHENDVLLGRGSRVDHYPGNVQFRADVAHGKHAYHQSSRGCGHKREIAERIVANVANRHGRFLQRVSAPSLDEATVTVASAQGSVSMTTPVAVLWMPIDHQAALAKTLQALREKRYSSRQSQVVVAARQSAVNAFARARQAFVSYSASIGNVAEFQRVNSVSSVAYPGTLDRSNRSNAGTNWTRPSTMPIEQTNLLHLLVSVGQDPNVTAFGNNFAPSRQSAAPAAADSTADVHGSYHRASMPSFSPSLHSILLLHSRVQQHALQEQLHRSQRR